MFVGRVIIDLLGSMLGPLHKVVKRRLGFRVEGSGFRSGLACPETLFCVFMCSCNRVFRVRVSSLPLRRICGITMMFVVGGSSSVLDLELLDETEEVALQHPDGYLSLIHLREL